MKEKKKKILVVEDDPAIRSMYRIKLEQEGFIVFTADNGAEGLSTAVSQFPDLVLLDIMLPQVDGFAVLQQLRANKKTKNLPIIMLTNLGTDEDKNKGEKYGATDYLVKSSLTPTQISQKVKGYL